MKGWHLQLPRDVLVKIRTNETVREVDGKDPVNPSQKSVEGGKRTERILLAIVSRKRAMSTSNGFYLATRYTED